MKVRFVLVYLESCCISGSQFEFWWLFWPRNWHFFSQSNPCILNQIDPPFWCFFWEKFWRQLIFLYVQLWKNTLRQEQRRGTMPSTQFQRTELRMMCMQHWLSPSTCAYQWKTSDFGAYLVSHEGLVAARPKNVAWRRLICSHVK